MSFLSAHRALPFSLSALALLGMLNGCRDGADGPTANSTTSASENEFDHIAAISSFHR
jgi:phosphatidylserine synthase